jgi:hypothetical protein
MSAICAWLEASLELVEVVEIVEIKLRIRYS